MSARRKLELIFSTVNVLLLIVIGVGGFYGYFYAKEPRLFFAKTCGTVTVTYGNVSQGTKTLQGKIVQRGMSTPEVWIDGREVTQFFSPQLAHKAFDSLCASGG